MREQIDKRALPKKYRIVLSILKYILWYCFGQSKFTERLWKQHWESLSIRCVLNHGYQYVKLIGNVGNGLKAWVLSLEAKATLTLGKLRNPNTLR